VAQGIAHFERRELSSLTREHESPGLVVTNPPYGERIGDEATLRDLYAALGKQLRENFVGWKAAVLIGNPPVARAIGIHATLQRASTARAGETRASAVGIAVAVLEPVGVRVAPGVRGRPARGGDRDGYDEHCHGA